MSLQETQVLNMPMCMISLYCDDDDDVTTHLRYAVPVEGIKEKKTIYLMRHTQGIMSSSDYYCCNNCNSTMLVVN